MLLQAYETSRTCVECLVRHLNNSTSRREGVECLARRLESDCAQERGNFRKKGVCILNHHVTMAGGVGFGPSP